MTPETEVKKAEAVKQPIYIYNNKLMNVIVSVFFISFPFLNVAINLQPFYLSLSGFGPRKVTQKRFYYGVSFNCTLFGL